LPRDLSGHELAKLLRHYDYVLVRQSGSHLRLKTSIRGFDHQVTIPAHKALKVSVASYLNKTRDQVAEDLFSK
jgi:predicted RNA binding protein YcfA (HicA-like mRNA interferase family)